MHPVDLELHEYAGKRTWVTTGRSLKFRFPRAYLGAEDDAKGGPLTEFYITYDIDNEEPYQKWVALMRAMPKAATRDSERLRKESDRKRVSVRLAMRRVTDPPLPAYRLDDILKDRTSIRHMGLRKPTGVLPDKYFGFTQFENERERPQHGYQFPPFDRGKLFARENEDGRFDTIVICTFLGNAKNDEETMLYPICHSEELFEDRWEMMIVFSGQHLSEYDAVIAQARRVLTDHLVGRTEPHI
jgi:hypothetical protein